MWNAGSYRQPLEQEGNPMTYEILASNLFNCCKEAINAPPVPSISRCIHIVYQHKNVWEYQWSNFIYNCMSTFLHYVHCKDALLDCSAPGGERCESLTWVDEISSIGRAKHRCTGGWLILRCKFAFLIIPLQWNIRVCWDSISKKKTRSVFQMINIMTDDLLKPDVFVSPHLFSPEPPGGSILHCR